MQIFENTLDAIGGTPLVRLGRIHRPGNLVAKLEFMNPGGNVKERIAVAMIDRAEQLGLLKTGRHHRRTHLGQHGRGPRPGRRHTGIPSDLHRSGQSLRRETGPAACLRGRGDRDAHRAPPRAPRLLLRRGAQAHSRDRRRLQPRPVLQPGQPRRPLPNHRTRDLGADRREGRAVVAGAGTGGTITGVGRYLKERGPDVLIVGADPEGSIYTAASEAAIHQYQVEGVGEDFWPEHHRHRTSWTSSSRSPMRSRSP